MAKLDFDATKYEPWQGSDKDTPREYAWRLWLQYQNADDDMDLATACELAPYDLEVYNGLRDWAWSQDVDAFPVLLQAALGRVLGRKPPRKGTGATARRDASLRAIAAQLRLHYGLAPTRGATSVAQSASAILSTLPGTPSEKTIINVLTRPRK